MRNIASRIFHQKSVEISSLVQSLPPSPSYLDFQKFFKQQTGQLYCIDDINELLFEWMPLKGEEGGMSTENLVKFLEHL